MASRPVPAHCPLCGNRWLQDPQFCSLCMGGEADPSRGREILEAAEAGQPDALRMLSMIDDARAMDVLLGAVTSPRAEIRRAAFESLGAIGDPRAEASAMDGLGDPDARVRDAAIGCLAELGGSDAADALAARLDEPEDRVPAATALAWLRDERAIEPLLGVVREWDVNENRYRSPAIAIAWLGQQRTVRPLADVLAAMVERWVASRPEPGVPLSQPPDWAAHTIATDVATALAMVGGREAEEAVARARERMGGDLRLYLPTPAEHLPFAHRAPPDERRTVPRWSLQLRRPGLPARGPVTKFGGQPYWLQAPTWPIAADGGPMVFMAQFAVPGVEGLAFLFIDPSDPNEIDFSDPGFAGCLLMQPGPPPELHFAQERGPTYASEVQVSDRFVPRMSRSCLERRPTLEEGLDYPDWEPITEEAQGGRDDDRDWNKLGGSPRYLQGGPPPGDWRFLFQFTAAHVGHEMGDGAECYGLIDGDRRGLFLVESH